MTARIKQTQIGGKTHMYIARVNMVTWFVIFVRILGAMTIQYIFSIRKFYFFCSDCYCCYCCYYCSSPFSLLTATMYGFFSWFDVVGFTGGLPLIKHNDCVFFSLLVCDVVRKILLVKQIFGR